MEKYLEVFYGDYKKYRYTKYKNLEYKKYKYDKIKKTIKLKLEGFAVKLKGINSTRQYINKRIELESDFPPTDESLYAISIHGEKGNVITENYLYVPAEMIDKFVDTVEDIACIYGCYHEHYETDLFDLNSDEVKIHISPLRPY